MANVDIVLKMYEYFNTGELDRIRADLFHPEIVWRMPGHHPLAGTMTGAEDVMAFFGDLSKAAISVTDVHFGELEDGTVVEKHRGHASEDGEVYVFPTCTTYSIEDDKIRDVQVHTADQHGVDRYMWTRFELKSVAARLADG
jgi:ketosteroid isomerase-like protein